MSESLLTSANFQRRDGRQPSDLRPVVIVRRYTRAAPGSVLIHAGETIVLCTASIDESLPPWMKKDQTRGWVTAEYNMLPGSTSPRKARERAGKVDGRTTEIPRLIGRSLRAVVDLEALGPRQITVDCDVLQADGGTRTLSITGGFVALVDAVASIRDKLPGAAPVFRTSIAAISLGLVDDRLLLDHDYSEDASGHTVDSNAYRHDAVRAGEFVEIQGTAEGRTFTRKQLDAQLDLACTGIEHLTQPPQREDDSSATGRLGNNSRPYRSSTKTLIVSFTRRLNKVSFTSLHTFCQCTCFCAVGVILACDCTYPPANRQFATSTLSAASKSARPHDTCHRRR